MTACMSQQPRQSDVSSVRLSVQRVASELAGVLERNLHGIEVEVGGFGALAGAGGGAGRSAATHADTVCRAANLDNEHAQRRVQLVQVPVVDLSQAAAAGTCG